MPESKLTPEYLRSLRASIPPEVAEDGDLREQLILEARKLQLALEKPNNVQQRVCFQVVDSVAISIGIRMGLFKAMKAGQTYSVHDLATKTNSDPLLVERILRLMAAYGSIDQQGADSFALNTVSETFQSPLDEAALETCLDFLTPGWLRLPDFLKELKFQLPKDSDDTAFHRAYNKPAGTSHWDILISTSHGHAFNTYMSTFSQGRKEWFEFYPVEERLASGADASPDAVAMVDVGGGFGHQAIRLKEKFPNFPGRFVVQDLAHALPADPPKEVEFQAHDFTEPQPIKNARLYYLRYVPHDWPQEYVVKFVTQLAKAMKPGYSRLVVNEWIVPAVGANRLMMATDMNMMATGGGMERTEALHRDYLERAGLKVTKVYLPGDGISEAVIEAEVA